MSRPGENDPCARCGKPYSAHIIETDPPQHADCKGFRGPERYDEKNPLHKALADLALLGVLNLFDELYERRHVIREPAPSDRWGVYCIPINRSASDPTRCGWTTDTCLSEGATIEEATSQGLRLDAEQRRAPLPSWSYEVREIRPDGTPGAFGPSLTVAAMKDSETGEPPRGSRLWRCEQELKRTRERMVDAERWRSEVTRAVQGLYAREADGYYRVAKGTLDSLFAIFQPGTESVAPKLSVREAARRAQPIDGADAQALEGALGQAERDLWEMKVKYEEQFTRAEDAAERHRTYVAEESVPLAEHQRELAEAKRATGQFLSGQDLAEWRARESARLTELLRKQFDRDAIDVLSAEAKNVALRTAMRAAIDFIENGGGMVGGAPYALKVLRAALVAEQLAEAAPPTERDDPPPRDIWKTRHREAPGSPYAGKWSTFSAHTFLAPPDLSTGPQAARGDVAVHYVHASVHISAAEVERCVEIGWDRAKHSAANLLREPSSWLPSGGQNARLREGLAEMILAMRHRKVTL